MAWSPNLTNLNEILADLYPTVEDSRRIVNAAGLPARFIAFNNVAINNWFSILSQADLRGKVALIIDLAVLEYPDKADVLNAIAKDEPPAVKGVDIQADVDWSGTSDSGELEKIIGNQSTLLPIAFLARGLVVSKSVGRVVLASGGSGSGFLVGENLLLTNYHVIRDEESALGTTLELNYQMTGDGLSAPVSKYALEPERAFATSKEDDWTIVAVAGDPVGEWGSVDLKLATPAKGHYVSIIQHPGGGPKQVGLFHNAVVFADDKRVQYLTDTLPGSSGSPVFNHEWEVVALHHSGGWLREPGSKVPYYRNEGIHINVVLDGIEAAGIALG
jgi:hypothetical protein